MLIRLKSECQKPTNHNYPFKNRHNCYHTLIMPCHQNSQNFNPPPQQQSPADTCLQTYSRSLQVRLLLQVLLHVWLQVQLRLRSRPYGAMAQSDRANWRTWRETEARHATVISIRFIRRPPAAIRSQPAARSAIRKSVESARALLYQGRVRSKKGEK